MAKNWVNVTGFQQASGFVLNMQNNIKDMAKLLAEEMADIYAEEVMDYISSGQLPALSANWLARKARDGAPVPGFYEYHGDLLNNFTVKREGREGFKEVYFVGFEESLHNKDGRSPIMTTSLVQVLENNYNRPIFEPAYERAKPKLEALAQQFMARIKFM